MENECLLDMGTKTISPPSLPKDHSPSSFSHDLTGHLGIVNLGTEIVTSETQNMSKHVFAPNAIHPSYIT